MFTRNDCQLNETSQPVSFEKIYQAVATSILSQEDADSKALYQANQLADSQFNIDGQAYANVNGVCQRVVNCQSTGFNLSTSIVDQSKILGDTVLVVGTVRVNDQSHSFSFKMYKYSFEYETVYQEIAEALFTNNHSLYPVLVFDKDSHTLSGISESNKHLTNFGFSEDISFVNQSIGISFEPLTDLDSITNDEGYPVIQFVDMVNQGNVIDIRSCLMAQFNGTPFARGFNDSSAIVKSFIHMKQGYDYNSPTVLAFKVGDVGAVFDTPKSVNQLLNEYSDTLWQQRIAFKDVKGAVILTNHQRLNDPVRIYIKTNDHALVKTYGTGSNNIYQGNELNLLRAYIDYDSKHEAVVGYQYTSRDNYKFTEFAYSSLFNKWIENVGDVKTYIKNIIQHAVEKAKQSQSFGLQEAHYVNVSAQEVGTYSYVTVSRKGFNGGTTLLDTFRNFDLKTLSIQTGNETVDDIIHTYGYTYTQVKTKEEYTNEQGQSLEEVLTALLTKEASPLRLMPKQIVGRGFADEEYPNPSVVTEQDYHSPTYELNIHIGFIYDITGSTNIPYSQNTHVSSVNASNATHSIRGWYHSRHVNDNTPSTSNAPEQYHVSDLSTQLEVRFTHIDIPSSTQFDLSNY